MDRRNRGEVLFYALQCAKLDRAAMADCLEFGSADEKEALSDIKMFERLQIELFGTCESAFDVAMKDTIAVPVTKIRDYISGEWSPPTEPITNDDQ